MPWVLSLLLWGPWISAVPPEGIQLSPEALDFGDIEPFSHHEAVIRVTLRARTVAQGGMLSESDCTCLASRFVADPASPTTVDWRIELDPCDSVGEVRRSVSITVGGQRRTVPVRYHVRPAVFADPAFVSLGLASEGSRGEVTVRTLRDEPVQLLAVTSTNPHLHPVLIDESACRERPARIRIDVDESVPAGEVSGELFVETAHEETPRIRIPVVGEARSGIRCEAQVIEWSTLPLGAAKPLILVLSVDGDTRIINVRSSNEAVDVPQVQRDGNDVRITLVPSPKLPLGGFHGHLSIETQTGSASRSLRLPFRGQVVIDKQTKMTGPRSSPLGSP